MRPGSHDGLCAWAVHGLARSDHWQPFCRCRTPDESVLEVVLSGTSARVQATRHTLRFSTVVLLLGGAFLAPPLATATMSFFQLIRTTRDAFLVEPVPEPAALVFLGTALAATAWLTRRARTQAQL